MTRKEFYTQTKATMDKVFSDFNKWKDSPESNDIPSLDNFLSSEYNRRFNPGDIIAWTGQGELSSRVTKIKKICYRAGDGVECYVMVSLSGTDFADSTAGFNPVVDIDALQYCTRIGVAVECLK